MIITRNWLNEWIDIENISTQKICEILNSTGLEVDGVETIKMPKNVVVAKVISKEKHPDADKLSVCKVDTGAEVLQVVCGAKNVEEGQFIAFSKIGAILPNGLEIKQTILRDVESNGMICSSSELGLPKTNDGIMILDESLGKFELGDELSSIKALNDDIIEIGLTPNRGDCLSVYGVARDLSVSLELDLKHNSNYKEEENVLGIGRFLSVSTVEQSDFSCIYRIIEIQNLQPTTLMLLRLAILELKYENSLDAYIQYCTHSTGVLFRAYNFDLLNNKEKVYLSIDINDSNLLELKHNDTTLSKLGIFQENSSKINDDTHMAIIEACYVSPEIIINSHDEKQTDWQHYKSLRGSETNLKFGMEYLLETLGQQHNVKFFSGSCQIIYELTKNIINFSAFDMSNIIGQEIGKNQVVQVLKKLGFDITINPEHKTINAKVPHFRTDIKNVQDISEEILRMQGIDNIKSKPIYFYEKQRTNQALIEYQKKQNLRIKAASLGFYECIHYVFDNLELLKKYNLKTIKEELDIKNPITLELNTLRTTLILHLLESAKRNTNNSRKTIALFEIGRVFDENRVESNNLGLLFSGFIEEPNILNHAKPSEINFIDFLKKIKSLIGDFTLEGAKPKEDIFSPYEFAYIMKDEQVLGYIARLHLKIQKEYDLKTTYVSEIYFDKIPSHNKIAKAYSKQPSVERDLSFLVDKNLKYKFIKEIIQEANIKYLKDFFPIDKFSSQNLGDKISLTLRFVFQDDVKTLKDKDVNHSMSAIETLLKQSLADEK